MEEKEKKNIEKDKNEKMDDGINIEIRDKKSEDIDSSADETSETERPETVMEAPGAEPDELSVMEAKLKEQEDRFLRLAAEFDNFKKRTTRQFENMAISSAERIIAPLLEVVDNFRRGLDAAENNSGFESLKEGMELTYQQLISLLEKEGLEAIESMGKQFDPNLHEAMMQIESDEDEGIVVQELVKGYKLKGRVIRHARVAVSRGRASEDVNDTPDEDKKDE